MSVDGLMAFWMEIDRAYLQRFREWHNCEHAAERVSIPGFVSGQRYAARERDDAFLIFYETESTAVLGSEAYQAALNRPTPWTKESLAHFRNPARTIYTLTETHGAPPPVPAPYVASLRFNLPGGGLEELKGMLLRAPAAADLVARVRLYAMDEAISGIMTSERKIYGGGPGKQQYLALYEILRPFDELAGGTLPERAALEAAGLQDLFLDRFWLEFALRAPGR